jgi:hypothetical protein
MIDSDDHLQRASERSAIRLRGSEVSLDAGCSVQQLHHFMSRELDLLVAPLRGPLDARDETGPVNPAEVTLDKGVARLRLVRGTDGQAQAPRGVRLPEVTLEVSVARAGVRRDLPQSLSRTYCRPSISSRAPHSRIVDLVTRHSDTVARHPTSDIRPACVLPPRAIVCVGALASAPTCRCGRVRATQDRRPSCRRLGRLD